MTMAAESALKDLGEIYTRLLDQKAFLQGQINFVLQEFEEKRQDRELTRLNTAQQNVETMSNNMIPESCNTMHECLPKLIESLKKADKKCQEVLEERERSPKEEWLLEEKSKRADEWRVFIDNMCVKSEAVDREYDHEVAAIKNYYQDLEDKVGMGQQSSPS